MSKHTVTLTLAVFRIVAMADKIASTDGWKNSATVELDAVRGHERVNQEDN